MIPFSIFHIRDCDGYHSNHEFDVNLDLKN